MRRLRLMMDWGSSPLWEDGNLDLGTLPLSTRLRADLTAWADRFDETLDHDDPAGGSGFDDVRSARAWLTAGAVLASRVREELRGLEVEVVYVHETQAPESLVRDA